MGAGHNNPLNYTDPMGLDVRDGSGYWWDPWHVFHRHTPPPTPTPTPTPTPACPDGDAEWWKNEIDRIKYALEKGISRQVPGSHWLALLEMAPDAAKIVVGNYARKAWVESDCAGKNADNTGCKAFLAIMDACRP